MKSDSRQTRKLSPQERLILRSTDNRPYSLYGLKNVERYSIFDIRLNEQSRQETILRNKFKYISKNLFSCLTQVLIKQPCISTAFKYKIHLFYICLHIFNDFKILQNSINFQKTENNVAYFFAWKRNISQFSIAIIILFVFAIIVTCVFSLLIKNVKRSSVLPIFIKYISKSNTAHS